MNTLLWILFILMILAPMVLYLIQKQNLIKYKLTGRTPIEIECWLKSRKWYQEYRGELLTNLAEGCDDEDEVMNELDKFCSGEYDKTTIGAAFPWSTTQKGTIYWGKKEYEFLKWYFGQYVDFHLISSR